MITSYFKVLMRNLWKNKFFTILNMTGLAIGMACYLLIFKYASFELSYDNFHENKNNIYRIQKNVYENNVLTASEAKDSYNLGPGLKAEFPEIADQARVAEIPSNTVIYQDKTFRDEKIYVTESSFFNVFSFRLLQGDPKTCLDGPNSVLISESAAAKYFGGENPMGKTLRILSRGREYSAMINGVFKNVPENSLLKFDFLLSMSSVWGASFSDWIYSVFHTYLLLTPDANPKALEAKFPGFINQYILPQVPRAAYWKHLLQPLKDIYLYSNLTFDTRNGDGKTVYFLLIIAFLILIISWINYVNLSTARAMERAREVGMRKVMGSSRLQLIRQFLVESMLVNIIPIIIAFILFLLFIPYLRHLVGKGISVSAADPWFWLNLLGLYIVGSILSGLYPAFVLSSFKPVTVLKRSKLSQTRGGILLRKILVIFQFTAATVLIIVIFTVFRQIEYMRSRDLGIDIRDVLGVQLPSMPMDQQYIERTTGLKTGLSGYPWIQNITGSSAIPGTDPEFRRLCWREGIHFKDGKTVSIIFVDYEFLPTYGLELKEGRNFSRDFGTDTVDSVIVNEAAVKLLGLGGADDNLNGVVGKKMSIYNLGEGSYNIIGVIKDYHHQSLKKNVDPIAFVLQPNIKSFYSLKLDPAKGGIGAAIGVIKQKWQEIFPGYPFDYFFMDDHFDRQYRADKQFGKVLGIFVILAIIITCLGLLGLSYFTTFQRTKEIGIRKTMGAGMEDILILLSRDIVRLVIIATVLAWPVAYFVVANWLKNYASRIAVPILYFILAGLLTAVIALLTVAYHTITAARANPVDTLREE
ncbi:MAG: putative transport system permease protein [Acidobacteriota bacterium]|nr:putative transport system permease protein [Acidobacteriota bacterium]